MRIGNQTILRNAIYRSITQDEIVHIQVACDSGDVLVALDQLGEEDVEYVMLDREGSDVMDVWTPSWRLAIKFIGGE